MSEWYCLIAGREIGPLTAHQLKVMASEGNIHPSDQVRQIAMDHWVSASHVRGLFAQQPNPEGSSHASPVSIFDATEPHVAWPEEKAELEPPPESHGPPPLPPAMSEGEEEAFQSTPLDFLQEPIGGAALHRRSLVSMMRTKRKHQKQLLIVGSLIFVAVGLVLAVLFLMIGNYPGAR